MQTEDAGLKKKTPKHCFERSKIEQIKKISNTKTEQ